MPAIPWKSFENVNPDREYLVMASRLPLKSYLRVPGFMRFTMAVQRQLATAEGLIGYSLTTEVPGKRFFTLSAWTDQQHLDAFARALPHLDVMRKLRPHMLPTTFVTWNVHGRDIPVSWEVARSRLDAAGDGSRRS